jgi:hypothetical protein
MPPRRQTKPWVPRPLPWAAARLDAGGKRLRLVYVTGAWGPADRADVRWGQHRVTVTLSYMAQLGAGQRLPAVHRCAELSLSRDASQLILLDGANGERHSAEEDLADLEAKLSAEGKSLDAVFTPTEVLAAHEVVE